MSSAEVRHERDAVPLMSGLLLLLVASGYLVADLTSVEVEGRWLAPLVLIVVGAAGLLSALRTDGSSRPG